MPEPVVVVERHDQVALLRLNRPAARNALNAELAQAAIDAVDANQDAGCIVDHRRRPGVLRRPRPARPRRARR